MRDACAEVSRIFSDVFERTNTFDVKQRDNLKFVDKPEEMHRHVQRLY